MRLSSIPIVVAVLVGALIIAAGFMGFNRAQRGGESAVIPPIPRFNISEAAEPKPGREIYNVMSQGNGPKITEVVIDGFDAHPGEPQAIRARVSHVSEVSAVSVTVRTDAGSAEHPLALSAGTATDGRWEGSWVANGTHLETYQAIIRAASSENSEVILSFK